MSNPDQNRSDQPEPNVPYIKSFYFPIFLGEFRDDAERWMHRYLDYLDRLGAAQAVTRDDNLPFADRNALLLNYRQARVLGAYQSAALRHLDDMEALISTIKVSPDSRESPYSVVPAIQVILSVITVMKVTSRPAAIAVALAGAGWAYLFLSPPLRRYRQSRSLDEALVTVRELRRAFRGGYIHEGNREDLNKKCFETLDSWNLY